MHDMEPVLVVEDEENIRKIVMRVLQSSGIDCEAAANAIEAVERVKRGMLPGDPSRIAVVLTDLRLGPGPSGLELISQIRGIDRQVSAIIMTGYATDAVDYPDVEVIRKPFSPEDPFRDLVLKVKGALEKRCSRFQISETHAMMIEMHRAVMHPETGLAATGALARRTLGDHIMETIRQPIVWGLLILVGGLLGLQAKEYSDMRETYRKIERRLP